MGLNRGELRFIEFKPLPETLIFVFAGLCIGFLQWTILRKYFLRSVFWIFASTIGWGICVLTTFFAEMVLDYEFPIFTFILGALLYGAITGGTIMWILRKKENI